MSNKSLLDNYNFSKTISGIENIYLAIPEIFIFCSLLVLLIIDIFFLKEQNSRSTNKICIFIILVSIISVFLLPSNQTGFNSLYIVNDFTKAFKILILLTVFFVLLLSQKKSEIEGINFSEFNFLLLLSTCGMLILVSSYSFLTFYLALELQALPIYVMCALRKNDLKSSEAALKYFLLGALSSGFLLFGISLIYWFTGTVSFEGLINTEIKDNIGLNFGLIFLLAGLAFKISSAPFHMWAPDVYEGTPSPITFFIASAPKMSVICILTYLIYKIFSTINDNLSVLIIVLSVSSMLIGSIGAIVQKNLKRLIAYSSIAHIGFILVGIVSFSEQGISSILYYFIIYMFLLLGVFTIILSLKKDDKPIELISDLKGLYNNQPFISISLLIFMFSLAGIPPLSGFFGKWLIFYSAVQSKFYLLAILGVLFSVISAFYYLKIIRYVFFENTDVPLEFSQNSEIKFMMYISLFITLLFFLILPLISNYVDNIMI